MYEPQILFKMVVQHIQSQNSRAETNKNSFWEYIISMCTGMTVQNAGQPLLVIQCVWLMQFMQGWPYIPGRWSAASIAYSSMQATALNKNYTL
jgi:hypothetical protein